MIVSLLQSSIGCHKCPQGIEKRRGCSSHVWQYHAYVLPKCLTLSGAIILQKGSFFDVKIWCLQASPSLTLNLSMILNENLKYSWDRKSFLSVILYEVHIKHMKTPIVSKDAMTVSNFLLMWLWSSLNLILLCFLLE